MCCLIITEKSSFLGGKKDYWNYFIDGLNSVKGVNDGLKFVKTRSEVQIEWFSYSIVFGRF